MCCRCCSCDPRDETIAELKLKVTRLTLELMDEREKRIEFENKLTRLQSILADALQASKR